MTAAQFRRLALAIPEVIESAHMDHPDFRIRGKIFATLGAPDKRHGMVKLPPDHQHEFMQSEPEVFTPAAGAWGRQGATLVLLAAANPATVKNALAIAARSVTLPKPRPRK